MERKIGEIFEFKKDWYQCVEGRCKDCHFSEKRFLCKQFITKDFCTHGIIFKKLEKVGEPYEHYGKLYQCYKLPVEIEIRLLPDNCYPVGKDNLVEIEIKQTKEDMEEKKLNLKPFNLEAAKAGKPVCTRDGRKARIICFDAKFPKTGNIVTLVEKENGEEVALYHYDDGHCSIGRGYDLMMLPEKKEGWINIYEDMVIYESKEEAELNASKVRELIATAKVKWEE